MHKVKARDFVHYPTGTEVMNGVGKWVPVAAVRWSNANTYVKVRWAGSTEWREYALDDTFTVRGDVRH